VFIRREDAFAVLEDLLGNEPEPEALLSVVPIELPPAGFGRNPPTQDGRSRFLPLMQVFR
jgi:hypothetical protein